MGQKLIYNTQPRKRLGYDIRIMKLPETYRPLELRSLVVGISALPCSRGINRS